jgi:Ion channel
LSFFLVLTLISGAFATIQHRILIYLVVVLAVSALAGDLIDEFVPSHSFPALETTIRLVCLSILVFMTLKRTLRPGPVTLYRVMGGIAGYLLIGFTWTFAYQLVVDQAPSAIHFASGVADRPSRQPPHLIYFSFVTLTTVGYGDAYPVHPAARSLAVAEALVGQLYLAILIASLVGMALQANSASVRSSRVRSGTDANKDTGTRPE